MPGQAHESTQCEALLETVSIERRTSGRTRKRPERVAADKAYHAHRIRHWLQSHGIQVVIPRFYRDRNVIERCIGWLKECRSVATRYEKLAVNYLQLVKLAFIERYLRLLIS